MLRITVDTGVFVDYIDKKSPYHRQARVIIESLGKIEMLLSQITLMEVCYITARILSEAGVQDAFDKAVKFVTWLCSHPAVSIVNDLDLHIEATRIKLKYGIVLPYCYVLALSKLKHCKAVFRKRGKNIPKEIEKDFEIIFLEDY